MSDKKTVKIFAVSDIHGCVRDLKRALMQAGFYPNSPKHLLVICGDNFDRGKENAATYAYLRTVKNKIMIRGNHEDILTEALERGFITKTDEYNGTVQTVEEFFGASSIDFFASKRSSSTSSQATRIHAPSINAQISALGLAAS